MRPAPMGMNIVSDGIRSLTIYKGFSENDTVSIEMKVHDRQIRVNLDYGSATLLAGMLGIYLREFSVNNYKK